MQPRQGRLQFPLRSTDCADRVVSFVVGGYKRHPGSEATLSSSSAFEANTLAAAAGTAGVIVWRTAVPNQHVDEQTKRNYVLEVSRRLNLKRRDMASLAHIADFRCMNYWIHGKRSATVEVRRTGALLYSWAVSTDSRVAVPMSREEEAILRKHHEAQRDDKARRSTAQ